MDALRTTGYNRRPPYLVAEHNGFFANEGLDVKFHETTFAPDHNRGMSEGRWDFSLSSADTMIARSTTDGVDYLLFMQAEEGLTASLVGQPEVGSIERLRGKLLAGDPGDSNLDLIRKKILRTHGMDDTEYRVEIIGSSPKRYQAFMERRVLAAMLTPPWSDRALASGAVLLADAAAYVPQWPLTCGWALRKWLESHREITVRFIRAWAAATDWLARPENREAGLRLVMEKEGMNRASAERACARVVPKARINPAALETVIELRKEMGVYKPPFAPPERFYDTSYWREATGLAD